MTGAACTVFDRTLVEYDFGATHPMNPIRVELTMRLADELGLVATGSGAAHAQTQVPAPVADETEPAASPHRRFP